MARLREFFDLHAIKWKIALVLSIIGQVLLAFSAIAGDKENRSEVAQSLRLTIDGTWIEGLIGEVSALVSNDVMASFLIWLLTTSMATAIIYIFKIPNIRKISIQILASGYYENFLHGVIQ